ncbi:diguanylate cyclase (GGDEF)-like protein [Tibeticola sediminis]|uniref:Diguanylate cyclase (GGDEF)-like protein n=1 Tax=Tibeticola sediminis TaxID=1917811 RepID=A0A3N4UKM9_9BURK|nr:EAL domain-containing protein [Tibeticola sediminis]RPE70528.1 diguanylate cyclase (GGDEF)-like protein [Tibeticola sediminis]
MNPSTASFLSLTTQILEGIAKGLSPTMLAEQLCRSAEVLVPGRIASIMRLERDGRLHVFAAPSAPTALRAMLDGLEPGPCSGSCGSAVFLQQPSLVAEIDHDPRWDDRRPVAEAWNLHSCWSWPVWCGDVVAGTFALTSTEPGAPTPEAQALLEFAASLAGTLFRLAELEAEGEPLQDRLRAQARRDPLTGVCNRLGFEEALNERLAAAAQAGTPLTIARLDLDDFRAVNDRHGRATGDACLRQVAEVLQQRLGAHALVARPSGDEFNVVLEGEPPTDTLERTLGEFDLRVPLGNDPLGPAEPVRLTASVGLVRFPADGRDADTLLRRAGEAFLLAKRNKGGGPHCWVWTATLAQALEPPEPDLTTTAAYGAAAQAALQRAQPSLSPVLESLSARFYALIANDASAAPVLAHLTEAEQAHAAQQLIQHLQYILTPDLNVREHQERSRQVGRTHALVGMPTRTFVRSLGFYAQQLRGLISHLPLPAAERRTLAHLVSLRLQTELEWQLDGAQEIRTRYNDLLYQLEAQQRHPSPGMEYLQDALEAVTELPGMVTAGITAPDVQGRFVVEVASQATPLIAAIKRRLGSLVVPSLHEGDPGYAGVVSTAWMTERTVTLASVAKDGAQSPWRDALLDVGIRSAAAVPLSDPSGRITGVLALYGAYPGMFENPVARSFIERLGQTLARGWNRRQEPARTLDPVPVGERRHWRTALFGSGLVMQMQPIVDLRTGLPYQMEALARLRLADGSVLPPGRFLPWLGRAELVRLFRHGLELALARVASWQREGHTLKLSVNLPVEVLLLPECPDWVSSALAQHGLEAERLLIELLEDAEFDDAAGRDEAVAQLAATGVRLAMDDLGSGYSSLVRLRTLPFHTVKIDQGLVREAHRDPARALGFIGALIQLAHNLGLWVVVEGLETPDLIEAAAILGADAGQGYGLARPMDADAVSAWLGQFSLSPERLTPQTALGRVAHDWVLRQRERAHERSA